MARLCSIILPLYNRREYVGEAVRSVLAQTRRDWELIVYDDGSTDDSLAVARDAAGGDERVRFERSDVNRGTTSTLAAAFRLARGVYFGTLDSDDRLHRDCLRETARVLDRYPATGMVYTQYRCIDADGRPGGLGTRCRLPFDRNRLLVDFMCFHFRLIRRSVYEQVGGFDPAYERAPDYDLCLRLSEVTDVRHVAKPLYDYRVHDNSVSVQTRRRQTEDSRRAVEAALRRRGVDDQYEIQVTIAPDGQGKFRLRPRTVPGDPGIPR